MTKVIRAKLSNYIFAWLGILIILSWFWKFYELNQDTYIRIILGMLSITLILYLVRKNKIQKDESIVAKIAIYFFIWIGISSLLVLVVGSSALTLGSLITALVYIVICAASGQNRVFGIELPSTFVDYLSNNSLASKRDLEDYNEFVTSTTSKIPLAIGLIMGILVTFVIEYLLYILKYLIAINNLSG